MEKQPIISGTYSAGKTTLHQALKPHFPDHYHVEDGARVHLGRMRKNSNELNLAEKKELQLNVLGFYLGAQKTAEHIRKKLMMDGSLIEVYAYSLDVLSDNHLIAIEKELMEYKDKFEAFIVPPTIPLEDDGLRHIDSEFRVQIHKRVVEIIQAFNIPHTYVIGQSVPERVEEVLSLISQNNGSYDRITGKEIS